MSTLFRYKVQSTFHAFYGVTCITVIIKLLFDKYWTDFYNNRWWLLVNATRDIKFLLIFCINSNFLCCHTIFVLLTTSIKYKSSCTFIWSVTKSEFTMSQWSLLMIKTMRECGLWLCLRRTSFKIINWEICMCNDHFI